MRNRFLQFLLFAAGFAAVLLTASCAYLYLEQDTIIFRGVATDPALAARYEPQRVGIRSGDIAIEGWWLTKPESHGDTVALYFGGNVEDVLYTSVATLANVDVGRVLVTNYRGYGGTPGEPSQDVLYSDALAVYDYAVSQPGVHAHNIVLVGRSLGSGVATYVAAHRPVRGVVLVTPYDSILNVAQTMYPLLPMRLLVKHPFPSHEFAAKIKTPVLILAGDQDVVIPAKHAQRLHDAWAGPKLIHVLAGVGHNNLSDHAEYYPLLNAFLRMPL
jgi:pimeloyl-ACP methyl ester carboxylesterase